MSVVAGGVGHDLPGLNAGLRVQQPVQEVQPVCLGAGHDDRVDACVVVGGGGERGHAAAAVEVAAVESGVERAVGDDESHPVDRGDLPAAPQLRQP